MTRRVWGWKILWRGNLNLECHGEDFWIGAHGEEIEAKEGRDSKRERRVSTPTGGKPLKVHWKRSRWQSKHEVEKFYGEEIWCAMERISESEPMERKLKPERDETISMREGVWTWKKRRENKVWERKKYLYFMFTIMNSVTGSIFHSNVLLVMA